MLVLLLVLGGLFLLPIPASADPGVLYVAPTTSGSGDCSSWANAGILQTALTNAVSGDEIWAKVGVHYPGAAGDRTATFTLKNGVALYGGFAGWESELGQRDWTANITVLSGDIDQNDLTDPTGVVTDTAHITGTNAYHVVTSGGMTETAVLDGFTITAGQADGNFYPGANGGGMYNYESSPTLTNITFSGNFARSGGGIYNENSHPTLTSVIFSNNAATVGRGGGMSNHHSNPRLTDVTFGNNSAYEAGGMYNYQSSPTLTEVTFSANTATQNGGGMYNWINSNPTLSNVTFSDNAASKGGGINSDSSNPMLINVIFSDNTATEYGGGMYNYESSPTLTEVTFSANSANYGGGMYNYGSSPTLTDVIFITNTVTWHGGGMSDWYGSQPTLTSVLFSSNSAFSGGAMFNSSSHPALTDVTFNGNSADGGGAMYNRDNSSPTLTNVILWGNTAPSGAGIYNDTSTPQISYSDIQGCGGSGSWNSACGADGGGNIEADPLFVDPANGNLRLQLTSPAIDAGNNTAFPPDILTDLDGNPRFVDIPTVPDTGSGAPPIVDMGAYEAQVVDVTLSKAVLPLEAAPGEAITFSLTLTNTGSLPATGIVVTDTMPAWLWGVSFTSTLSVTDTGHVPPFVWLVQDLTPGQGGLITVGGVLTMPLAAGTYTNTAFISAADDLLAENNTAVITFTVPNVAPVFTSAPVITATEDAPYTYTTTAQDGNGDALTITALTLPGWLAFSDHSNGTATLAGTPTTADVGEHAVELVVTDSARLTDTQAFILTVAYVNDPPEFTSEPVTTATQDVPYTYAVTADDPDLIHGDTLTITAPTLPGWLAFSDHSNGTATLAGTPTPADVGDHAVVLRVADSGGLTDTQAFTVTVAYVNDPPEFTSAPVTTATQDVPYTYAVTADDPDLIHGDALTITAPTLPVWLTLEDHGDGTATLSGTPTNADVGEHTVVLRVIDSGGLTDTQTFTITVWGRIYLPLVLRNTP
ncbi:MAG: DUF11 domain-containing protein [Chloroflexi bacterium]|nr:DUF11 domain-containing protein [Chloroflexota bacterium]MBU1747756.1 DUF11 domain-containing protein [Chloroflexota bacterium]